jgi:hypothetical protein
MWFVHEPDIFFTDMLLAAESVALAVILYRTTPTARDGLKAWTLLLFASTAVASLIGGIHHGFFWQIGTAANSATWAVTLMALGANALASFNMSAWLFNAPSKTRSAVLAATAVLFVGYCAYVLTGPRPFVTGILAYLPGTLALLAALTRLYLRERSQHLLLGISGILLTFSAAGIQQLKLDVNPTYFDHNALYHVIQAVALVLLYVCFRGIFSSPDPSSIVNPPEDATPLST